MYIPKCLHSLFIYDKCEKSPPSSALAVKRSKLVLFFERAKWYNIEAADMVRAADTGLPPALRP